MKHVLAVFAFGILVAPVAVGQTTEKEAVKVVQAAVKERLKTFKTNGTAALATLNTTLTALEGTLATDTAAAPLAAAVADAAAEFAESVAASATQAQSQVGSALINALGDLANGGSLDGIYPEPLYAGQKGALEGLRDQLVKATAKLRTSAVARLGKTVLRASQISGVALRVTLRLDVLPSDVVANEGAGLGVFGLGPFLDVAVSGSRLDTAADGVIVIAGHADISDTDVHVTLSGPTPDGQNVTPDLQSTRFIVTFDDTGAGLEEGNYAAAVSQSGGPFGSTLSIGVR